MHDHLCFVGRCFILSFNAATPSLKSGEHQVLVGLSTVLTWRSLCNLAYHILVRDVWIKRTYAMINPSHFEPFWHCAVQIWLDGTSLLPRDRAIVGEKLHKEIIQFHRCSWCDWITWFVSKCPCDALSFQLSIVKYCSNSHFTRLMYNHASPF